MGYVYAGVAVFVMALLGLLGVEEHRITKLEEQVTTLKVENQDATKRFKDEAALKETEYKNDLDTKVQQLVDRNKAIADLSGRVSVLNGTIATYAKRINSPVSTATGSSCPTDRSEVLAGLLEQCNGLLISGANAAQRAANQITALSEVCK